MTASPMTHQYIERGSGRIVTEQLYGDRMINFLYNRARENTGSFFKALTSSRSSKLLGFFNYDLPYFLGMCNSKHIIQTLDIDIDECIDSLEQLNSPRKIFERKINYWEKRSMPDDPAAVVSPADSKMLVGSFENESQLFIKEKFFHFDELIGPEKKDWLQAFSKGSYAIFRLTPEKYHYNHAPVSGKVVDIYELDGIYHSCNPGAVIVASTPYSKNKRVVTIIDTQVPNGTGVGVVAMIEIVALMIGDILQCYSKTRYLNPQNVTRGMFLQKGQPKSLYRPGSSLDVLIFQKDSVTFCDDIVSNMHHPNVKTRFSKAFGRPVVETEVKVRSHIATRCS